MPTNVHRMNICIEVQAVNQPGGIDKPEFEKASLTRFSDIISYIQALTEKTKDDARGSIGAAHFSYSTEWNVLSELLPDATPETAKTD